MTDKEKIKRIKQILDDCYNSSWQYTDILIDTISAIKRVVEK